MKKILILTIVLALLLSVAGCSKAPEAPKADAPEAPAPEQTEAPVVEETKPERISVEEGQTVVDFELGTEGLIFWDMSAYGFTEPQTTMVTGEDAAKGQALRMDINGDNTRGVMSLQAVGLTQQISGAMANVTEYEYMRFWVNNQGGADVSIAVIPVVSSQMKNGVLNPEGALLFNQYGEEVSGWPDNAAQISTVQGGIRNTSLSIPAGFVGWAYYPLFDQVCWWEGVTLDEEQMKIVDCLTLDIRYIDATEAEYLVIDDICLTTAP